MEKISKLDQSTPFGGDDNAALIAELKRQGYTTYYYQDDDVGQVTGIANPFMQRISMHPVTGQDDETANWKLFAERLKTDPRSEVVKERLHVLARLLLTDIYYIESQDAKDTLRLAEASALPSWRRAVMMAGKILSLDLGPVHGS